MELSGLELTLRRISAIENQFQEMMNFPSELGQTDSDFQRILDSTYEKEYGQKSTINSNNASANSNISHKDIDALIDKYSSQNNLDPDFVKAVVKQESGFNPNAKSHCGAMGLMQLMPATAQGLGVTNAFDAEQNIYGGTKYLKGLMDRFGNNKELALAAYNAGPNAVKKYNGIPPYKETQNYVKNVMASYGRFKDAS
ncbi:MAG: lytic transglycosylase domain-containing protein [Candidatus Gastranaerophilaceae bacterium]